MIDKRKEKKRKTEGGAARSGDSAREESCGIKSEVMLWWHLLRGAIRVGSKNNQATKKESAPA